MGAWSTAIFGSDLACDVRDEYRELIGDGLSDAEATRRVFEKLTSDSDDAATRAELVIALAITKWKVGRLDDSIRDQALAAIDAGADLERWVDDPKGTRQRVGALRKARDQLVSPQRTPVKIRRRVRSTTPFVPGDVFTYVHDTGVRVVFWVSKNTPMGDDEYSVVELLPVGPDELPDLNDLSRLDPRLVPVKRPTGEYMEPVGFWLWRCQRLPPDRFAIIGRVARPDDRPAPYAPNTWVNPSPRSHPNILAHSLDRRLDRYI